MHKHILSTCIYIYRYITRIHTSCRISQEARALLHWLHWELDSGGVAQPATPRVRGLEGGLGQLWNGWCFFLTSKVS